MRPDLMVADESSPAADAELTMVPEPGMPGVDKRTVLPPMEKVNITLSRGSSVHLNEPL